VYTAYSDGASRGNPGPSSCSYVIYDHKNKEIDSGFRFLGERTNNYAEYQGLIDVLHALEPWVVMQIGKWKVKSEGASIYCDSKLVVMQVTGKWKVKHEELKPLCGLAQALLLRGRHSLFHIEGHSGIQGNERADELCNECLDGIT
jgi:ribonuclease HI